MGSIQKDKPCRKCGDLCYGAYCRKCYEERSHRTLSRARASKHRFYKLKNEIKTN